MTVASIHSTIGRAIIESTDAVFLIGPLTDDGFVIVSKNRKGLTRNQIKTPNKDEAERLRWRLVSALANVVVVRDVAGEAKAVKRFWPALAPSVPSIASRRA